MEGIAAVQDAADGASNWSQVAERLWELLRSGVPGMNWHALAFDCQLAEGRNGTSGNLGISLMCFAFDEGTSVGARPTDEAIHAWQAGLTTTAPIALSRYGDLLWTYGRNAPAARTGIAAYLAVANEPATSHMTAALSLCRALRLAAELNDQTLMREAADAALARAKESLEGDEHEPGIPLRLAGALARLPTHLQPPGIDDVLATMEQRYDAEPPVLDGVTDLICRRSEADASDAARRRQIDRWVRWGDAQGGPHRFLGLRKALEIAQISGLRPEIETLRLRLQQVHHDDLDLKPLSYGVDVERARVDRAIDLIVGSDSFSEFLARLALSFGSPSGANEKNRELIEELMREYPLSFLFPQTVLGPENTRLRHVAGDDEHMAVEIIEQEARSIAWFARLSAEALDRAFVRYGAPALDPLAAFFRGAFVDPSTARGFARAVELHSQGDFDSAAHVIAPRLERSIRAMARAAGLLVVREPSGDRPGGVRTLNELLPELVGLLDESWRRYLSNLLAEPLGVNLRNRIGHGLVEEATRDESAILIHAASWLGLLGEPEDRTKGTGDG